LTVTSPIHRTLVSALWRPTVLVLALFHSWLFWNRLADGRFLEPAVAFRWIAGALILAGFLALRRLGNSRRSRLGGIAEPADRASIGRKSLVLWLFVVLLHLQAIGASSGAVFEPAVMPGTVAALGANLVLAATATALGFVLLARARRDRVARLLALRGVAVGIFAPAAPAAWGLPQVSSRPPPA
jgi:hypothetical protein